jgi:SagB-type dehydrogenase family enzyme
MKMLDPEKQAEIIAQGRRFMRAIWDGELAAFESDQDLKMPQPPLVKAPMRPEVTPIDLSRNFETLDLQNDLVKVLTQRRSSRYYSQENMTLLQLSFLLWASQGIKDIRGKSYATLRTVPSGGARHPFETYLLVRDVEGLEPGKYHYLPMSHQLEFLGEFDDYTTIVNATLQGQTWAAKANVIFYWSFVAYRAEWRYGVFAHRICLVDAGHMDQNLYIACTGLGLGTCAIGAFEDSTCNALFDLDGEEEFMVYVAPVGTIQSADDRHEKAFYQDIIDQGL